MKKIVLSLSMIVFVGAIVIGATGAFFSDTETSTGNTFTAGAIDLQIDNESYYSAFDGFVSTSTSWILKDLEEGDWFFHFEDLKPGDWGEDTISLHVTSNEAYACLDVRLDEDEDNGSTEPELNDEEDYTADDGELAEAINFIWWADDGDNVREHDEELIPSGPLGNLEVGEIATVVLADSQGGIFESPLQPGVQSDGGYESKTYYIGKAWCFGQFDQDWLDTPPQQDGVNNLISPITNPVECDGSNEDNSTQTDSLEATISFMAVQARNNSDFVCEAHLDEPV